MTPGQRRRLSAVLGMLTQCVGCLQENLIEASLAVESWSEELHERYSALHERLAVMRAEAGLASRPLPAHSTWEERQAGRKEAVAAEDECRRALEAATLIPVGKRQVSCPACLNRRRSREQISALASRVVENYAGRREEEKLRANGA